MVHGLPTRPQCKTKCLHVWERDCFPRLHYGCHCNPLLFFFFMMLIKVHSQHTWCRILLPRALIKFLDLMVQAWKTNGKCSDRQVQKPKGTSVGDISLHAELNLNQGSNLWLWFKNSNHSCHTICQNVSAHSVWACTKCLPASLCISRTEKGKYLQIKGNSF